MRPCELTWAGLNRDIREADAMRDLISDELGKRPYRGMRRSAFGGIEDEMTEQGFKRFRRRKSRAPSPAPEPLRLDEAMLLVPDPVPTAQIAGVEPERLLDANVPDGDVPPESDGDLYVDEPLYTRDELEIEPFEADETARVEVAAEIETVDGEPEGSFDAAQVAEEAEASDGGIETPADTAPEFEPIPRIQLPATPPEPWQMLRQVPIGVRQHILKKSSLISFFRADPAAQKFDLLRTQLLRALKDRGWSRVAVVSPTKGCGSTFVAVNLALSLSRVPDTRTVLMDLNHRDPGAAKALEIEPIGDMPAFLAGQVPLERQFLRCSANLAVGLTSYSDLDASEILHDATSRESLMRMQAALRPDVVLYDLPPLLEFDDTIAFLPQVDGVLLVADGTKTTDEDLAVCERLLEGESALLGVVLNRGR